VPASILKNEAYVGKTDLFKVDPTKIVVREGWNPRTVFNIEDIKSSIQEHGFFSWRPLLVKERNGVLELLAGERRLRAVLSLLEEGVPITSVPVTLENNGADADLLINTLLENQGEPLSPIDEAHALQRLQNYGWEVKQIAQKMGKSVGYVYGHLKLLEAGQELQEAVHQGEVGVVEAVEAIREGKKQGKEVTPEELVAAKDHKAAVNKTRKYEKAQQASALHDLLCAAQDVVDVFNENGGTLSFCIGVLGKALNQYDALHPEVN